MTTALIIEDNEDNRIVMTFILKSGGYEVIEAETGNGGYQKAVEEIPDFILLDIQLPDINGTEVLKQLRDNESTREIVVIASTSYAMSGDRQRLLEAGCDGYLEKPIDPARVLSQIKAILEQ
ncbi:MAG: response regulator [Candidatus Thiodiazotropha sp. (ex. Lucinisca nassula)]|nr:response regulator [Candidatus Thiodiazotropha sp. (ex. Lucinisca nassula)]MBW9269272.1 response regulator [Candidatus Thiodiazotropha sp. (ex. Lucinisca nassula)]